MYVYFEKFFAVFVCMYVIKNSAKFAYRLSFFDRIQTKKLIECIGSKKWNYNDYKTNISKNTTFEYGARRINFWFEQLNYRSLWENADIRLKETLKN